MKNGKEKITVMKLYDYLTVAAVVCSMTACEYTNHFLDEDEELPDDSPYQTKKDVNASAYNTWTYINLATGETEVHPDAGEWIYSGDGSTRPAQEAEAVGIDWHIAIHRYEIKTNGASVLNTGKTDIQEVENLPEGEYTPDRVADYEMERKKDEGETQYLVITDMSNMMGGTIGYAYKPMINTVLCDGITKTATGSMPPTIYGTTGEVFALKWDDGSWAAFQITATYSTTGASGYMSFNYKMHTAEKK